MNLEIETYHKQEPKWPPTGRFILANYDEESIVVYQAYGTAIGHFAAQHGYFGGDFRLTRMSWIKPNFLWMMHRSGWASKQGQEVVLAIRIQRSAFDLILSQAVHSSYNQRLYQSRAAWQRQVAESDVRLQWDPDHGPSGEKLERRAIQLGLRNEILRSYAREWIIEIIDLSEFVRQQREHRAPPSREQLQVPRERPYPLSCENTKRRLQLDSL